MSTYIFTHQKPDADAFGTALALAVLCGGKAVFREEDWNEAPATIKYLANMYQDELVPCLRLTTPKIETYDTVYVVDCGDPSRIEWCGSTPGPVAISIDHHGTAKVGAVEYVDTDAASTAQILSQIYYRFEQDEEEDVMNDYRRIARAFMLAAHLGDTCWMTVGVNTDSARCYAGLVEMLDPDVVAGLSEAYHNVSWTRRLLLGAIVKTGLESAGRLAVTLYAKDKKYLAPTKADMAGLANEILQTRGIKAVVLNLEENDGTYRYQFRTRGTDNGKALEWAKAHEGAGHSNAAGGKGDRELSPLDLA